MTGTVTLEEVEALAAKLTLVEQILVLDDLAI
jgi:hypothetical protein